MTNTVNQSQAVKDSVREFYNSYPASNFSVLQKLALPKLIRGKKVLDAGCGSGFFLFDDLFFGADVTAIDQSQISINFIREQAQQLGYNPTLIRGDLETVSLPDDSFDFIFSTYVIHHTPNPQAVLEQFRRWCKKDGSIRLVISHKYNPDVFMQRILSPILYVLPWMSKIIPENIRKRTHGEDRFHHPYWKQMSKREAIRYCEAAGLEVKSVKVNGFTTFLLGYFIPPILSKLLDTMFGPYLGRAIRIEAVPRK
jgi:ubiquinone/menaquinone biosynthesis C-methylase UbiE